MATRYTQNFTLTDIFNNKALKDKLPLINYKEIERENGKISKRTNAKTINRQVFDTATSAARPFYKPIQTNRNGDIMIISGNLVGDHDTAVDSVYNALLAKKDLLTYTVNNADLIRDAIKESAKNKRLYGIDTKLYLSAQSMQQIQGMNKQQIMRLMDEIMENIFYGDNFPKTQKKWGLETMQFKGGDYKQRQLKWKQKVGD